MQKYFMFNIESLSFYCLYEKRLVETICYSEITSPRENYSRERKNEKRKECGWNISVGMADGGEICGHPNLHLIYGRKINKVIRLFKFGISICACCWHVVASVVSFFFIKLFRIRILLFCCCFYQSKHALVHR